MRRAVRAGITAGLCLVLGGAGPAVALDLSSSIDLDYTYSQTNLGGDVDAATTYNQKYQIKYETSLTSAFDFIGAVRLDLQDAWYTDMAATSKVAPTLELQAKGSQAAAKFVFEEVVNSTDAYHEASEVTSYSTSMGFDFELTPEFWPEVKLKYQRRGDFQEYAAESTSNTFEFSTRKDFYGLRLELNLRREDVVTSLPARSDSAGTKWAAKATYKDILWGGTEFELAYEINEDHKDERKRGFFSGETPSFNQILKTRFRNSLLIAPRITLGLVWEYQYEQDLLALEFDYTLKNKYALDLRWDAYEWFKVSGEARRETDLTVAVDGEEDERTLTDSLRAGFDLTSIPWLLVTGKAELKSESKIVSLTGGSVDKIREEKYEIIAKNRIGEFWDFTVDASAKTEHTDDWLSNRETRVKAELQLKLLDLIVTPMYEVSRTNEWERGREFPDSQQQVRDAKIKIEYTMQLLEMFKATFSHEYGFKVADSLDEFGDFTRLLQFNEDTRLSIVLAEIVRYVRLEGEIDRTASDTEGDLDPELVGLSYALKLDWKLEQLSVLSSIKYNDKGDTFDDLSFNTKATWKGERLEVSGEYQFDKIIKDATEPMEAKRKLNLRLNYKF